jgi:hypothetical protein
MRQIFVDTRDKVPGGTNSNFSIVLPQTLSLGPGHQGRIDDFRLPMSIPTIHDGNNSITVTMQGGGVYTVFLGKGQYANGQALAAEIQAKLRAGPPGEWIAKYYESSMILQIYNNTNGFQFTGGSFMSSLLSRGYDYTGGNTYEFPFVTVQGLDMCYLCCSQFNFSGQSVGPKGSSDILCAIPIVVGYGSVQHYSMSSSVFFDIPALTTQQLSFQLRDRNYNILNIVAGISFTLTID